MGNYTVSSLTDRREIRSFLHRDIDYAAYAMGDLEPPYAEHAAWFGARSGGALRGLALHYAALDPAVLFLMGEAEAMEALLEHRAEPRRVYYTAKPETESLLCAFYRLHEVHHMYRMRVRRDTFRPVEVVGPRPAPLDASHVHLIGHLQSEASEADGRALHDVAFSPEMLRGGAYFGILDADRLLAVAGTHLLAPQAGMAALGNVVTRPEARGQGYGTIVSQAVTESLLARGFELIVLNVRRENHAAIRIYHKLGYYRTGDFIEGFAERRD